MASSDLSSSFENSPTLQKQMLTSALLNEVMVAVSAQLARSGFDSSLLSDYNSAIFELLALVGPETGEKLKQMLCTTIWALHDDQILSLLSNLKDNYTVSLLVQGLT